MYTPDIRDTTPDGWDWNCNNVEDKTLLRPSNVPMGCAASGQGACAAGCTTISGNIATNIPCGGFMTGAICASMGCGNPVAPGCGTVSGIQMAPQACK